jgi:hypothetical protein
MEQKKCAESKEKEIKKENSHRTMVKVGGDGLWK